MEIAAILLARAMGFVEPIELNPKGKVFYPDLVKALVDRYNFQKFPQKLEEFDEVKGITFASGKYENIVIEQLIIYKFGILVDTRVSTSESKRLLEEAIQWASKELGLTYKPIHRWQYASQITFQSKVPLAVVGSAYQKLAESTSKYVSETAKEDVKYEVTTVLVDHDQLARKHPIGRFSIQRRENTPFSENKYFSDAPLTTEVHVKLLEQFEANLSGK